MGALPPVLAIKMLRCRRSRDDLHLRGAGYIIESAAATLVARSVYQIGVGGQRQLLDFDVYGMDTARELATIAPAVDFVIGDTPARKIAKGQPTIRIGKRHE
jgi:hypothetical protein